MRIVEVTWLDAHAALEALSAADIKAFHRACSTYSVGYEIQNDASGISLGGDFDEDGIFDRLTFIPKGMIEKITVLKGSSRG